MSRKSSPKDPPEQEIPFEEAIRQLSSIVEKLESGDLPLDESITLFEQGIGIAQKSRAQLDRAEKKVEELLSVDAVGVPVTRPFDTDPPA